MYNKKKIVIISIIAVILLVIIGVISTLVLKSKPTSQTNNEKISDEQYSKIVLKAKASGKILKFNISFEDIENIEFNIEKSYNQEFDNSFEVTNSQNNNQAQDDLTGDLENNVEKCFYRVKAKDIENGEIIYSNVVTITLKKSNSDNIEDDLENIQDSIDIKNGETYDWNIEDGEQEYFNDNDLLEEDAEKNTENTYEALYVSNNEVKSISLSETQVYLDISGYKTATLVATVTPLNAQNKTITWSSSNSQIVTVDQNGNITAKSNGVAIITAKTSNGQSETCEVNVTTSPSSVNINKSSITLNLLNNREENLQANIEPSTSEDRTIIWTSSDENVAIVDSNGLVTANSNGSATIKAETPNGKSSTCQVNVITSGSGVYLNKTSVTLNLSGTKQISLKATVFPSSAVDKTITWTSSNSNIATVNSSGLVIAKSSGMAIITAKTSNGKTASCKVVVEVLPTSIKLNTTSVNLNPKENNKVKLTATVSPANTTDKTVKWSSSNSNIASVDSNGNVTAKKTGRVTITATCGNISARCNVTIMYEKGLTQRYDSSSKFNYWLYIPDASAIEDLSNIPLIIYLHGNGEIGNNNLNILKNNETLVKLLAEDTSFNKYGAIIIAPQSDAAWYNTDLSRLKTLVDNVVAEFGICKYKISITGVSGGGSGCWDFAVKYPDFVSCVVPVAGYRSDYNGEGNMHQKLSLWGIVGQYDSGSINNMKSLYNNFKNYGGSSQLTIVPGYAHSHIGYVAYKNYDVINWMAKQNKK